MIRHWLGIAFLAGSWLPALNYYQPANRPLGLLMVALGALLLDASTVRLPGRRQSIATLLMLLPGLLLIPWPYKAAPLLLVLGLALSLLPIPRRWPDTLSRKALVGGAILMAQSVTILAYAHQTARSHDLPWPLTSLLGGIARALGGDVAVEGSTLAIQAAGKVHRLGATWDLLFDPATLCFLVGGLVMLALTDSDTSSRGRRLPAWLRAARSLVVVFLAWIPFRAAFVLGLYLQRTLRADTSFPLSVMNQFVSWWLPVLLLAGPVVLAAMFVRREDDSTGETSQTVAKPCIVKPWHLAAACGMIFLATALWTTMWTWEPIGSPKSGRVMVVERHSQWEPTTNPYDEVSYGESASYTYRVIYDYAARFFEMSRLLESDSIDAEMLQECDVLVLKIPTARFSQDEVEAITRFVARGGGLLMVGDHTNVFKSSTYLNDVARPFGFAFRNDLLFRVSTPYEQPYRRPAVPHPAVQHVGKMDFAVSCSIDPGGSFGTGAIQSGGLWSIPAQYNIGNYHPPAEYRPEMRVGPFLQLWATKHGKGRVLAFTDSTIFSNFCIFQPGKAELMLNMLQWLNHRSPLDDRGTWRLLAIPLMLIGVILLTAALRFARGRDAVWVTLLAAAMLGWSASCLAVSAIHRHAMPELRPTRDGVDVVLDRTVSNVPLSKGAYVQGDGQGFGLLEQWITRLGYFTSRRHRSAGFSGEVLVVLQPSRSVSQDYRDRLVEFVAEGGKLLVLDSPSNQGSTANSLLWPFGLAMEPGQPQAGELTVAEGPTGVRADEAREVTGGQAIVSIDSVPVATRVDYGKGSVTAVGFGSTWNDAAMGYTWTETPDTEMQTRYNLLFALLRGTIEDASDR